MSAGPDLTGAILRALLSSTLGGAAGGQQGTATQRMQGPMGQLGAPSGGPQGAIGALAGSMGPTARLGADGNQQRAAAPGAAVGMQAAGDPNGAAQGTPGIHPLLALLGHPAVLSLIAALIPHLAQLSQGAPSASSPSASNAARR